MKLWRGLLFVFSIFFCYQCVELQQICSCDLYKDLCEVNCCCDSDCSPEVKATFQRCLKTTFPSDSKACFYEELTYDSFNEPKVITRKSKNTLLCLSKSNYDYFSYSFPNCTSNDCFNDVPPAYTYENNFIAKTLKFQDFTIGDYLGAQLFSVVSYFTIPHSSVNNLCKDNPVQYLKSQSSSCLRSNSPPLLNCSSNDYLNPSFYYDNIEFFGGVTVNLISCTLSNTNVNCSSFPQPNLLGCEGVVKSVYYTIKSNRLGQISDVSCKIVLQTIISTASSFEQHFSVKFTVSSEENTVQFSGNPGYIQGKPLLALSYNASSSALINSRSDVSISLLIPSSSGFCNSAEETLRNPLLFNVDMQSQCKITFTAETLCQTLSSYILFALEASTLLSSKENVYVASYGNFTPPLQNGVSNTVPIVILGSKPEYSSDQTVADGCENMLIGAHYTIVYAKIGDLQNPQRKVVGVTYSYETLSRFTNPCFSSSCSTNAQTVDVSMSVTYKDVSERPSSVFAKLIPIVIDFPGDFLFPFYSSSSQHISAPYFIMLLNVLLYLVILV